MDFDVSALGEPTAKRRVRPGRGGPRKPKAAPAPSTSTQPDASGADASQKLTQTQQALPVATPSQHQVDAPSQPGPKDGPATGRAAAPAAPRAQEQPATQAWGTQASTASTLTAVAGGANAGLAPTQSSAALSQASDQLRAQLVRDIEDLTGADADPAPNRANAAAAPEAVAKPVSARKGPGWAPEAVAKPVSAKKGPGWAPEAVAKPVSARKGPGWASCLPKARAAPKAAAAAAPVLANASSADAAALRAPVTDAAPARDDSGAPHAPLTHAHAGAPALAVDEQTAAQPAAATAVAAGAAAQASPVPKAARKARIKRPRAMVRAGRGRSKRRKAAKRLELSDSEAEEEDRAASEDDASAVPQLAGRRRAAPAAAAAAPPGADDASPGEAAGPNSGSAPEDAGDREGQRAKGQGRGRARKQAPAAAARAKRKAGGASKKKRRKKGEGEAPDAEAGALVPVDAPPDEEEEDERVKKEPKSNFDKMALALRPVRGSRRKVVDIEKAIVETMTLDDFICHAKAVNKKLRSEELVREQAAKAAAQAASDQQAAGTSRDTAHPQPPPAPVLAPAPSHAPKMVIKDGQIVLDESSLRVHADVERVELVHTAEEDRPVNAQSYLPLSKLSKKRWNDEETDRFYDLLALWGSNFQLLAEEFPGRTRKQLKNKFHKEERAHPRRVAKALACNNHVTAEAAQCLKETLERNGHKAVPAGEGASGAPAARVAGSLEAGGDGTTDLVEEENEDDEMAGYFY